MNFPWCHGVRVGHLARYVEVIKSFLLRGLDEVLREVIIRFEDPQSKSVS